jgi:hypothetical protein
MAFVNACSERDDLGGGRFRQEIAIKPVAYLDGGTYYRSSHDWGNGSEAFPHVVTAAPLMVYTAADGMRRICPTRETDRYVEIGAPLVKVGGVWTKPSFGSATRSGNRLTWHNPNADMSVTMAGHYIKADIELLGGYVPQDRQFAFPVGMSGLTRTGGIIYREGVPVMHLGAPDLYDAANPDGEHLPIAHGFVTVSGQPYILFTLPSGVTSMSRPVVDPTFESQPDAAAGKDVALRSAGPTLNYGSNVLLLDAGYRGLIEFDLSGILSSNTCTASTLYLYHRVQGTAFAFTISAYSIAAANAAWIEGTQNAAQASSGEPCWGALAADGAGGVTTAWAGSAGLSTSGTDYEADALGSFSGDRADEAGAEYSTALTTSRVQGWFGAVNTNYGMVLTHTSGNNGSIASSDHATASYRPKLTVEYTSGCPRQFSHYARLRRN